MFYVGGAGGLNQQNVNTPKVSIKSPSVSLPSSSLLPIHSLLPPVPSTSINEYNYYLYYYSKGKEQIYSSKKKYQKSKHTILLIKLFKCFFKHPDEPITTKEISQYLKISDRYVRKLAYELKQLGLIVNIMGRNGGYLLNQYKYINKKNNIGTITVSSTPQTPHNDIYIYNNNFFYKKNKKNVYLKLLKGYFLYFTKAENSVHISKYLKIIPIYKNDLEKGVFILGKSIIKFIRKTLKYDISVNELNIIFNIFKKWFAKKLLNKFINDKKQKFYNITFIFIKFIKNIIESDNYDDIFDKKFRNDRKKSKIVHVRDILNDMIKQYNVEISYEQYSK